MAFINPQTDRIRRCDTIVCVDDCVFASLSRKNYFKIIKEDFLPPASVVDERLYLQAIKAAVEDG